MLWGSMILLVIDFSIIHIIKEEYYKIILHDFTFLKGLIITSCGGGSSRVSSCQARCELLGVTVALETHCVFPAVLLSWM